MIKFYKNQGAIICGFASIGKSYYAKLATRVVDLESTPFKKDWKTYARVADHMRKNGYVVLISCHKELREELHNQDIPYYVALPRIEDKDIYIQRYKQRQNTEEFIKLLEENFEDFVKSYDWEEVIQIPGNTYLFNAVQIYNTREED